MLKRRLALAGTATALAAAALAASRLARGQRPAADPLALERALAGSLCASASAASSERYALARVAAAEPQALRYQGTHILTYGAMRELADHYSAGAPAPLRVAGGGCDDALAAVMRGDAHVGGLCCRATSTPARTWTHLRIALDLKAVIAHPALPLTGLSLAQLRSIAAGRIRRWSELGGPDRPVALVLRQHCPDFVEPVREALLGAGPGPWPAHPIFVDRDEQIVDTVARFESAVGVVSLVFARARIATGQVRLLALDGIRPDPQSAAVARYPLTGPLDLVMKRPSAQVAPFLRYLASAPAQALLARAFIPVPIDRSFLAAPDRA